ncbi:prevent-host-death protein [Phormidium tenue]|uniref:Prevent-host-death protein n=1 Tax=Phormidium tenue NIES-30 TaxID=549789 RepID=A0A1U7J9Y0_9CYAN|nr:prevent-host-death protein [Phormidium tenue]MBD2230672.1 prevent-host-death protein [Phormidium tenue FACHB-1052]OKH50571.1 prevent-host-death protein [Phormidium tenue NIES-30]
MNDPQVQYVSDDQGEVTGVILSIQLWRDILSELETQHLLKSETMRQRLLAAKQRSTGVAFKG